jgi:hypothetical protein
VTKPPCTEPSDEENAVAARARELASKGAGSPFLRSVTDPNDYERERTVAENSTAAFDPVRTGIGSSPFERDFSSSALFVPPVAQPNIALPVSSPEQRYLFRLATQVVTSGDVCRLRGIRQAVTIGQTVVNQFSIRDIEEEQVSPFWSFCDGNVSWHLRIVRMPPNEGGTFDAVGETFYALSNDLAGVEPALLYRSIAPIYQPPPLPGDGIAALATFYDIRYPWGRQGAGVTLDYVIYGPCIVTLFASVKQSNPITRIPLSAPTYPSGLPPEELFLLNYPNAVYRHISGSLICEQGASQRRPGIRPYVGRTPS